MKEDILTDDVKNNRRYAKAITPLFRLIKNTWYNAPFLCYVEVLMPFFNYATPEQIRGFCQRQPLEYLNGLNQRFGCFFQTLSDKEDKNERALADLNREIFALTEKIADMKRKQIEREEWRQQNLANLPSDGAERYLMMQQLRPYPPEDTSEYEKTLEKQQEELKNIQRHNHWIKWERHLCSQELKIVNDVRAQKRHEAQSLITNPGDEHYSAKPL